MSARTRAKTRDRMSQAQLDSLITRKIEIEPIAVEKEHFDPKPILQSNEEFDTLHPEETFKEFCEAVRNMLSRYEADRARLAKLESEQQDLLHFIEMSRNKNARAGFKLYQQLCEVRRERRVCKNEMDLLYPVYQALSEVGTLSYLSEIQGKVRLAKQAINNRAYIVRTNILDEFVK